MTVSAFPTITSQLLPRYDQEGRSPFLQATGEAYEALYGQNPQLNSDAFLIEAEKVVARKTFQDHLGSWQRLDPIARKYIEEFGSLLQVLRDRESYVHKYSIQLFVHAHIHFVNQFSEEFKIVCKHTKAGVSFSHPDSIEVFCNTGRALQTDLFQQQVLERDPSLFITIPYQTLIRIFRSEEERVPELFAAADLNGQKQIFCNLSEGEQTSLLEADPRTDAALSLYRQMAQTISDAQRLNENAAYFSSIMNVVLEELGSRNS